jgi:photosystem II stability/assembly factor-like uncharacterized protein
MSLTQPVQAVAVDPSDPRVLYAAVSGPNLSGQAIYKSTDAGQNWVLANNTIPVAIGLAVNPVDRSVIYAASYKSGLFKSTDAGRNWKDANTGLQVINISVLATDPANPAAVYAGGAEGLFKSLDAGATWKPFAAFRVAMGMPPPGIPLPAVPIPPAGPATVRSLLIDFTDPNTMYAGTRRADGCFFTDQNLYKSTDGGVTWTDGISPDRSGCLTDGTLIMDPGDPKTIYLPLGFVLDGYWLNKSTDGGLTWSYAGLSADYFYSLLIDPTNSAKLYASTDAGVFRSSDGGATWNATGLAQAGLTLLAIDPLHPAVVYAAGIRGLFKSVDSGATWLPIGRGLADVLAGSLSLNALIIDSAQSTILYLATSGYGVFKSSDGGVNWAAFNDGLSNLDVHAVALLHGDSGTIFAGTSGGIFKLVDGR